MIVAGRITPQLQIEATGNNQLSRNCRQGPYNSVLEVGALSPGERHLGYNLKEYKCD